MSAARARGVTFLTWGSSSIRKDIEPQAPNSVLVVPDSGNLNPNSNPIPRICRANFPISVQEYHTVKRGNLRQRGNLIWKWFWLEKLLQTQNIGIYFWNVFCTYTREIAHSIIINASQVYFSVFTCLYSRNDKNAKTWNLLMCEKVPLQFSKLISFTIFLLQIVLLPSLKC